MNFFGLDVIAWAMLVFFATAMPIMGRADMRALRRALAAGRADARLNLYERTMLFEWGAAILLAATWWLLGRGVEPLGLVPRFGGWPVFWSILFLAATAIFVRYSSKAAADPAQREQVRDELGALADFAPHTEAELRRFNWLSLTAGVCEEFLFRGLLMGMLAAAFGIWPAILLSSAVFGLVHAYQGVAGVGRAGLVGLVLALVVVLTGSLYVAILAHAAIDLAQGRMVHEALSRGDTDMEPARAAA